MTLSDLLKQILAEHFALIFGSAVGLVVIAVLILAKIFHELRTDKNTKKALKDEARFIRAIVAWFRPSVLPKPGEPDPLAETSMPFAAVKNPRDSGDKQP